MGVVGCRVVLQWRLRMSSVVGLLEQQLAAADVVIDPELRAPIGRRGHAGRDREHERAVLSGEPRSEGTHEEHGNEDHAHRQGPSRQGAPEIGRVYSLAEPASAVHR